MSADDDDAGDPPTPDDPVLVRRAQMARLADVGQRVGYSAFGIAIVLFVIGFVRGFTGPVAHAVWVCLIVGSAFLAPAIILGYAVKAADREDRGLPSGH